jgi:hypothetical protein
MSTKAISGGMEDQAASTEPRVEKANRTPHDPSKKKT